MRTFVSMLFLTVFSVATQAAPIEWTLSDVVFDDGTAATGSFFYDANTNVFSSIAIQTEDGIGWTNGWIYGVSDGFRDRQLAGGPAQLRLENVLIFPGLPVSTFVFEMTLAADMTGRGGTIPLLTGFGSFEDRSPGLIRYVVSGTVSAVPVPAAVWLFASALVGLGWLRRLK